MEVKLNGPAFSEVTLSSHNKNKGAYTLQGKLVHADDGQRMSHQKIALVMPGIFSTKELDSTTTDYKGRFKFSFNYSHYPLEKTMDVVIRVLMDKLPSEEDSKPRAAFDIPLALDLAIKDHKLEKGLKAKTYEFEEDFFAPKDEGLKELPQQFSKGYFYDLVKAALKEKIKAFIAENGSGLFTIEDVQNHFYAEGANLQLTKQNTIEMILNGIFPCYFRRGENKNELVNVISWKAYGRDKSPILPDATIVLEKSNDLLKIKQITIQFEDQEAKSYKPRDEGFLNALYLYNSAALVKGEAVCHLGMGHLFTEVLSRPILRHLQLNPLKELLYPHVDGTLAINRAGARDIFGPDGVLGISGLTVEGVNDLLKDTIRGMDYTTFKPRKPIISTHRFAEAENLYWSILKETVDQFFSENIENITSRENWSEIYNLSRTLVKNSLEYKPFEADPSKEGFTWADTNELDDPSIPRVSIKGEIKALRPITRNPHAPNEGDIERLKQFCCYTIFMATFWHWSIHASQDKWARSLGFASLGMESGNYKELGNTSVQNGAKQLSIANILVNFEREGGALLDNAYGKIYPPLIAKIKEKIGEFDELGYNVRKMPYSIYI